MQCNQFYVLGLYVLGLFEKFTKQNGLLTKLTVSNDVNWPLEIREGVKLSYLIFFLYGGWGDRVVEPIVCPK